METVDQGKFSCQECGKSYKWKPEFAGRKVKCKCGFTMTAPKEAPGAPAPRASDEPDLDALYSLADEGKQAAKAGAVETALRCPSCKQPIEPGAALCASCGFNLKTGTRAPKKQLTPAAGGAVGGSPAALGAPSGTASALAAYGTPRRGLQKMERGDAMLLDFYIPIGLIIVGMILTVVISTSLADPVYPLQAAIYHAALKLVLGFVLLAVGGIFCVKLGEIAFGEPGPAALKLAAFALAPPAIAGIISILVHDMNFHGLRLVGFFLAFGMFFTLAHYLFEWDMSEKWIITAMSTMVCMLAVPLLFQVIVQGGGLSGVPNMASAGAANEDAEVDYSLELGGGIKPARQWIDDSVGRILGSHPRPDSKQLIDDLYALGPQKGEIWVAVEGPQCAEMYVKLPSSSAKRKPFFDTVTAWNLKHGRTPMPDNGGKWMILTFMPHSRPTPP